MRKRQEEAILVIRPERLGDLVLATPTFAALKAQFPGLPLHVLTDTLFAEVLLHDPFVDRVITIPWRGRERSKRSGFWKILMALKGYRYTHAYILYSGWEGWNWILAILGVRRVAQIGGTKSALLFGHKMVLRKGHAARQHYVDWYLDVVRVFGAKPSHSEPRLYVAEAEREAFLQRFPEWREARERIIIHPFRPGSAPHFGAKGYQQLIIALLEMGIDIYISGSREDAVGWVPVTNARTNLLGKLSIREIMCACEAATLVIADSTGVLHLAAATGANTVGFFCPAVGASPALWGARGSGRNDNLTPAAEFCYQLTETSVCPGGSKCELSAGISMAHILDTVIDSLSGKSGRRSSPSPSRD